MEHITVKISAQTLNTIGAALREIPYKLAAPAIQEIEIQVQLFLAEKNRGSKSSKTGNADGGSDGSEQTDPRTS